MIEGVSHQSNRKGLPWPFYQNLRLILLNM
jgi:hypothetical protein